MPPRPVSIKVRALRWLAQREHSPQELRVKLLRLMGRWRPVGDDTPDDADGHGCIAGDDPPADPAAEVDALLQWLDHRGYLSSERFVESRVHARQARFGNLRIRHELQRHGLQLDSAASQALQASEEQRARDVWLRKYGQAAGGAVQRMQQLRFLAGRGFSIDVARRVVLGAETGSGDDLDHIDLEDPSV